MADQSTAAKSKTAPETSQAAEKLSLKDKMGDSPEMVQLGITSKLNHSTTPNPTTTTTPTLPAKAKIISRPSDPTRPEHSKMDKVTERELREAADEDSGLSDFDHVSEIDEEGKDEDARTRLKNVSIKSSNPSRGKLVKPQREENQRSNNVPEDPDYEELKAQLKAARREGKEQWFEMRDLEKQLGSYKEAYHKIRDQFHEDPRRLSKSERSKYAEHYQLMENHIHWQEHEMAKRNSHIEMLTKQTRDANGEREELESNNRKLQKQIKDINVNLTECKDDLLRLQPSSQVSDSEIGDKYNNLSQQITSWVDDQTEDSEALEERFEKHATKESLGLDPILSMHINELHVKIAQSYPDSIPLLIQYVIHRCLEQYVLGNGIYFYGLDIRNIGLLQEAEQGMKLLEPSRDAVTVRRWRSETLSGLSKSQEFSTAREQQGHTLAKTLYFAIARFLRGPKMEIDDDGWEELHKQVIQPAIELATAMRLSMTDYEVISRGVGIGGGGGRNTDGSSENNNIVHHNEIGHYQMIDNATHKIIRPDSTLKISDEGRIGIELLTVTPALMRTKNDGIHRNVLCKPTILVKLDEPMGKRSKIMKPLGSWTPNWFGGDSSVE